MYDDGEVKGVSKRHCMSIVPQVFVGVKVGHV